MITLSGLASELPEAILYYVQVSPPRVNMDAPLQLLCTNLDYDEHKGRIAIGRITSGRVNKAETVIVCKPGAPDGSAAGGTDGTTPPCNSHAMLGSLLQVSMLPVHKDCGSEQLQGFVCSSAVRGSC